MTNHPNHSSPPSPVLALRAGGMVTAIGNSVPQTAASWITMARRLRRVAQDGIAEPVTIADCRTVTAGLHAEERLAAMLGPAVAEAFEGLRMSADDAVEDDDALEILVLPTWLEQDACHRFGGAFNEWRESMPLRRAGAPQRLILRANAIGSWVALEHAYRALDRQPGLRHVMIAAVDSGCDPSRLRQATEAGWLLQRGNDQGFVAGEAAACLHLTRAGRIRDLPAGRFALHRPALLQGGAPLEPAMDAALANAGMRFGHISHLSSDRDGADWRTHIERAALDRLSPGQRLPHRTPATALGQTGAACGMIGWLLAATLHAQQIERVNTVLNWAVAPSGEAAACVLERSPH